MTVSYLVATTGREGLDATLRSIVGQRKTGDQVLVIGGTEAIEIKAKSYGCDFFFALPGNDWGHSERNAAMASGAVDGDYVAHLDDDDVAVMGSRAAIETAIREHAGKPLIFQMVYAEHGMVLWTAKVPVMGNIGTPMMVFPNNDKLGRFAPMYGGDFDYLQSSQWDASELVWVPQIIARIRPN